MKLLPWFQTLLLGMTLCGAAGAQTAASVTVGDQGVERQPLDDDFPFESINRSDCLANGTFTFPFTATGLVDDLNVVVWAGSSTDCTDKMLRDNDSACWQVAAPTKVSPIVIRMQDIVSQARPFGMATSEVCNATTDTTFVLYFLILNGSGANAAEPAPHDIWPPTGTGQIDLVGPNPPTELNAGAGESSIIVSFEGSTNSSDLNGYRIFCDPSAGAGDGGSAACSSSVFTAGEPPPDPNASCGRVEQTSTEITADNLENGVTYAVAIGAIDTAGNVGPLSALACATPQPVTGYFEAYRAAGGTAGGGFCALSRRPSPGAFGIVAAAALGLLVRRRARA